MNSANQPISLTGTTAPANSTCGKQSIGSASVACDEFSTAAEACSPITTAAADNNCSDTKTPARSTIERSGRRPAASMTISWAAFTTARSGSSTASFDPTYAARLSPTRRSRRTISNSPTICSSP